MQMSSKRNAFIATFMFLAISVSAFAGMSADTNGLGGGGHRTDVPTGYTAIYTEDELIDIGSTLPLDGKYILMADLDFSKTFAGKEGRYENGVIVLDLRVSSLSNPATFTFRFNQSNLNGWAVSHYKLDNGEYTRAPGNGTVPTGGVQISGFDPTIDHTLSLFSLDRDNKQIAIVDHRIEANTLTNSAFGTSVTQFMATRGIGNYTPIGTYDEPFTGVFDGNGYSINGLEIGAYRDTAGIFGIVKDATIKNLVTDANIESINPTVPLNGNLLNIGAGAIAGIVLYSSVTDCMANGDISVVTIEGNGSSGGLIGISEASLLARLENNGTITATASVGNYGPSIYTGGIVGIARGQSEVPMRIISCENNGTINIYDVKNNTIYCGGIVGLITDSNSSLSIPYLYSEIQDSVNNGNMSVNKTNTASEVLQIGGISGSMYVTNIVRCNNFGNITIMDESLGNVHAGGISSNATGVITGSFNAGDIFVDCSASTHGPAANPKIIWVSGAVSVLFNADISRCYNEGDIDIKTNQHGRFSVLVSGIASSVGLPLIDTAPIRDCYNTGDISTDWDTDSAADINNYLVIGGIVSRYTVTATSAELPRIINCYNAGDLTANGQSGDQISIGGVLGSFYNTDSYNTDGIIESSFTSDSVQDRSNGPVNWYPDPNPVKLSASEFEDESTFSGAGWNLNRIWKIVEGGTPVFRDVPKIEVKFVPMNGDSDDAQFIEPGSSIIAPTVERSGYIFEGWFTDINGNGIEYDGSQLDQDTVYYAFWVLDDADAYAHTVPDGPFEYTWYLLAVIILLLILGAYIWYVNREGA